MLLSRSKISIRFSFTNVFENVRIQLNRNVCVVIDFEMGHQVLLPWAIKIVKSTARALFCAVLLFLLVSD